MKVRCFIALEIPGQIKKEIRTFVDILKKYDTDVKWVISENVHLTLKFLGNTENTLLPEINDFLVGIVKSYKPFYIRITGTGVFPNERYPRVVWIGIEHNEILLKLSRDVENSMEHLGYQKEEKKFKPHLTIGRIRSQKGIFQIINELNNFRNRDFGLFTVDHIRLVKSVLKPTGPEYTCLYEIPVGRKT